jgi:hypothetical protein
MVWIKVSWFNSPQSKIGCLKLSGSSNFVDLQRTVTFVELVEFEWEDNTILQNSGTLSSGYVLW